MDDEGQNRRLRQGYPEESLLDRETRRMQPLAQLNVRQYVQRELSKSAGLVPSALLLCQVLLVADIAALLSDRARDICARSAIAGCVAVGLYGIAAIVGWLITGTHQYALGQIAAVPVFFALTTAVRGLGGMLLREPLDPVKVVAVDVGICVAGLVLIASVGSLANSGGYALYSVLVMAPFFVPVVIVGSIIIEVVLNHAWLIRTAIALAAVAGILTLVIFAVDLSGG